MKSKRHLNGVYFVIEIYYYVKSENVANILDCGLKLSAFHNKEVAIGNEKLRCFSGLLNPKDDPELYKSGEYTCLKVQVKKEKCFVADRFLYEAALGQALGLELYHQSILPVDKYIFGTYRLPECLITTTILAGEASVLDKRMDSPIIYTNSEELYVNNILQEFREQHAEFDDCLLYSLFDKLTDLYIFEKVENEERGIAVYRTQGGKTYCIRKPDFEKFYEIDKLCELESV